MAVLFNPTWDERQRMKRLGKKKPVLCEECELYPADQPGRLCPGCEAYKERCYGRIGKGFDCVNSWSFV